MVEYLTFPETLREAARSHMRRALRFYDDGHASLAWERIGNAAKSLRLARLMDSFA